MVLYRILTEYKTSLSNLCIHGLQLLWCLSCLMLLYCYQCVVRLTYYFHLALVQLVRH